MVGPEPDAGRPHGCLKIRPSFMTKATPATARDVARRVAGNRDEVGEQARP